jgi:predicted HAD superfamily phosphohydrolase YqeG
MTVKQIPSKLSGLIVDWDGTISPKLKLSVLPSIIRNLPLLNGAYEQIESNRGTRLAISKKHLDIIDKVSLKMGIKDNKSTIIQLLHMAQDKNIPWIILSDHSCVNKSKEYLPSTLMPLAHFACRDHALKPLTDTLLAAITLLDCPRHEILYIGDRMDTDAEISGRCAIPFIHIDSLSNQTIHNLLLR